MAKKRLPKENGENGIEVIQPTVMPGKDIEERLLDAGSEEELDMIHKTLRLEGVPDGSIRGAISRLRAKGKLIFITAVAEVEGTKPLPIEGIIKTIKLPLVGNGESAIFNSGVEYGMKCIVAGIRMAQELTQIGVAQARPLINMAQEMRKAEGMSAQEAGQVAAENALAGAIQYLSERPERKVDIATVPNPLMGIMARAMEPALTQAMSKMFSIFGGQPVQGGAQPGAQVQPQQEKQAQQALNLPMGWSIKEKPGKEEEKQDKEEDAE